MSVNPDIVTRYCFFPENSSKTTIDKALLQIPVNTYYEENRSIVNAFLVLEWLTAVRPYVKSIKFVNRSRGSNKRNLRTSKSKKNMQYSMQVFVCCTVRKSQITSFINFVSASFVVLRDKYLKMSLFLVQNRLSFSFDSFEYFVHRPEYLAYSLKIYCILYCSYSHAALSRLFSSKLRFFFLRDF